MATGLNISSANSLAFQPHAAPGADVLRIGVVGYGYWGPNIVRNFQALESAQVVAVCDKSSGSLGRVRRSFPDMPVTTDCADIVTADDIEAVAIVTPVWTHF